MRKNSCQNHNEENGKSAKYNVTNLCLLKRTVLRNFKNISNDGVVTNRRFWSIVKPFLTNKGLINEGNLIMEQ